MTEDKPMFGYVTPARLSLFTDLYELTMMQGYFQTGHNPQATFSLFFRDLPPGRGYAVAAGLEQAVAYLDELTFSDRAIAYLSERGFDEDFLEYLQSFEFTGEVRALPEGTVVFPNEPLLEVTAPILQAQLLETLVINQVGFQSLVATKAARMVDTVERHGEGQSLVDFGSRRAHGVDAGVKAARAAYVAGFSGTSNVAAGELFGIPISGTMAHSWVQSFPSEREAFEAFVDVYGEESVLLIDTYDTVEGAKLAVDVGRARDVSIAGVRLDSGDLTALSKEVSRIVDDVDLFISSGVDEYLIESFLRDGGVADGFGPGTALTTSKDAPTLDFVYKLVAVEEDGRLEPSMKLSTGKVTYPGQKAVRRVERDGTYAHDELTLRETVPPDEDLLVPVVERGESVFVPPSLEDLASRTRRELSKLPQACRRLTDPASYEVRIGESLRATTDALQAELEAAR
ncbi:MAG: nicotinate phosphoribosyltransferase [Halobacteriota archaeon]